MTTFDSHKWIKLYKESRLNEAEEPMEDEFVDDLEKIARDIAPELEDRLQDMESEDREVNEIVGTVVSIIGYILLSNTVVAMMSKLAMKLGRKYSMINVADRSEKIYDFAHKNEKAFMAPIKRIVNIFVKDASLSGKITYVLYALIIFLMAGAAGGGALEALKKSAYFESALLTLKSAIKGKEVSTLIKQVLS